MNYENDIFIDDSSLDVEWLEQPSLMMKYGRHEAEMERQKDIAKERLDLVKADLDRAIREDPEKFGIGKPTETAISNTIISQDGYKETYHEFLDALHEHNISKAAVRAFAQRKDALENLVRLNGQQYFAGPKVPRDLTEQRNIYREKVNKRVRTIRRKN